MFDSAKAKIGKKLPVEDDSIFEKIVEVSKNLKNTISHLTGWGVQMEAYRYILKLYRSALETGIMKKA